MSCRHDLANGTCTRCYPGNLHGRADHDRVDPGPEENYGPNLEGPGAVTVATYNARNIGTEGQDMARRALTGDANQPPEPSPKPDPLSDEQWRFLYQMVLARYQYEAKAWNHYRLRKAEAPFTGSTPVPPACDESGNLEVILHAIAKRIGILQ